MRPARFYDGLTDDDPVTTAAPDQATNKIRRNAPRWVFPKEPDVNALAELVEMLGIPEAACRLLISRGFHQVDEAKRYLRPRLDQLHDPSTLLGLPAAVERLVRAIRNNELVMIHGDYDVDGICSTTLLTRTIRILGGSVHPFIPNRMTDGYDLGQAGVEEAKRVGAKVVLTCDCGTSARKAIADLCSAGIDVIVTDHHLPSEMLPDCLAVLNPKREGCEYPDKDLAAVGVAFKLSLALARAMEKEDGFIWGMLDLVALATIADVAPLRGENRVMVRKGLKLLGETRNIGVRALMRAAGLLGRPLTAGRVGFILAPRLNAAGRLGHAIRGVELLLSESDAEANPIARELEELNARRQEIDRRTLEEAREMVAAMDLDNTYGIVLWKEDWHPGVIGIVASRVVEEFCRPTMLIAVKDGEGKGSGRSIPAINLHSGLAECRNLLKRFGGHRSAAGITIEGEQLEAFAARFNEVARSQLTPQDLVPELRVDLELNIDAADSDLEKVLRHFEPFGMGNPSPVFVARNVRLGKAPEIVGRDGLKLRLATRSGTIEALGWGMADRAEEFKAEQSVDVAFRLERDEFRGEVRLQARIADIFPHQETA